MRNVFDPVVGGMLVAALTGAAWAQAAKPAVVPPGEPASAPSLPASVAMPANAASRLMPPRNPALTAAENAQEPGNERPEGRLLPQIQVPFGARRIANNNALAASAPPGSVPGRVNPGAARCVAMNSATERAACERGLAASGVLPASPK